MRDEFGPWVPLSAVALERLQGWAPEPLPLYWSMGAMEFAARVCTGEFDAPPGSRRVKVLAQDLAAMRRTWSSAVQEQLIRAGYGQLLSSASAGWYSLPLAEMATALMDLTCGDVLIMSKRMEQMPDARPWLTMMAAAPTPSHAQACRELAQRVINSRWRHRWEDTWGRWIIRSYGCEGWDRVEAVALAGTTPLKDAVSVFAAGLQPLIPGAVQAAVARSLHREECLPQKPLTMLKAWLVRDPLAARALADHAPLIWVERLARNAATPLQTLDVFMGHARLPEEVKRLAWRNRLSRTQDAQELAALSARMPSGMGTFRNLSQWLVTGLAPIQAMGLVMTARRDGARLKQLQQQFGEAVFTQACADAVAQLQETARRGQQSADPGAARRALKDAAVLELVQHLGADVARSLMQALARCDHQALAGCKLDATYTRHAVPKRGGGERVISAPLPAVKQVQRAVLEKLLRPLPVHEAVDRAQRTAACGAGGGGECGHPELLSERALVAGAGGAAAGPGQPAFASGHQPPGGSDHGAWGLAGGRAHEPGAAQLHPAPNRRDAAGAGHAGGCTLHPLCG